MTSVLSRLSRATRPVDRTEAYGEGPEQVYDVRSPELPRGVTVLLVHGGFWRPAYNRSHTTAQSEALARNGFHVATIEYRRADRAGWPDLRDDLLAATAAVRGDPDLPGPVLTMGHSAGGHLALWLQHQVPAARILGTIALAPCADLRLVHDLGLDGDAARALMGTRPQQAPEAWRAADPALAGPPPAPVRILHGDVDEWVPLRVSQSYVASAGRAHVTLDVVAGARHFDLIDPRAPAFQRVVEAALDLAGRAR